MVSAGTRIKAVVGLLAMVSAVAPAGTASAATDVVDGVCGSNEICHFENSTFLGRVADWNACEPNWSCGVADFLQWDYSGTSTRVNDKMSSLKNRLTATGTSTWAMAAQHQFGGGQIFCFQKGSEWSGMPGGILDQDTSMWKSYNYC